jgi:hypothetical protein
MAYYGNEPAKVALKIGSGVITTTEIQDGQVYTADILDDAITSSKIDDDGTGFQVGSLGIGTSVTGVEKLTVGGTASFSGAISGTTGTFSGQCQASSFLTGDLILKSPVNNGHYTIWEEEEYLAIRNELTGKKYKFVLEEIDE